jgi:hypothetical protein
MSLSKLEEISGNAIETASKYSDSFVAKEYLSHIEFSNNF